MLAIVGQYRVGRGHLHHDSQRRITEKDRFAEDPGACRGWSAATAPYASATCRAPR